jgi:hypothetical protein
MAGIYPFWGISFMIDDLNSLAPSGRRSLWFEVGRVLFFVALAVSFFLLAQSMVNHRFFKGGRIDRHGTLRP